MLNEFYESIDSVLTQDLELTSKLKLLRDLLKKFIIMDEFRLSLLVFLMIDSWNNSNNLESPIFYHNQLNSVRVIWPAFYENNPIHKHGE